VNEVQLYDALRLVTLIHEIDVGLTTPEETYDQPYIEIRRWRRSDNDIDHEATAIIRALLRQELEKFPLDELGHAVLRDIDSRGRSPS
jgi:hypothetical protein